MRRGKSFGQALDSNFGGWNLSKQEAARRKIDELFATPITEKISSAEAWDRKRTSMHVNKMLNENVNWPKKFNYSGAIKTHASIVGAEGVPKVQSQQELRKYRLWEKEWARRARAIKDQPMTGKMHGSAGTGDSLENDAMEIMRQRIEDLEVIGGDENKLTIKINKIRAKHQETFHNPTAEEASGMIPGGGHGQGQIDKMWGRYGKSRLDMYRKISKKSYRKDLTPGGFLQDPDIDLKTLSEKEAREIRRQSEGFLRGLDIGAEASQEEIATTLAMREKDVYHNKEKLIGFTRMPMQENDIFMGRHTLIGSKLYMSPTVQRAEAIDMFAQSKVLRDSVSGKVIPYKRSITANLTMHSPVTKTEYLDSVRGLYKEAVRKGRIADVDKYRMIILDATVEHQNAFNPIIKSKSIKVHKTAKEIAAIVKHDNNIARSISVARGGRRATSHGYEDIKEIVERMTEGDEVFIGTSKTRNPRKAIVSELESLRDASVLKEGPGNKVFTWGKLYDETMKLDANVAKMPDLFEVSLIRNPTKGSKYSLDIVGGRGGGTYLGKVSEKMASTIGVVGGEEIVSGYVGKAYVRPYILEWNKVKNRKGEPKWHPTFTLGIWGSEEAASRQAKIGESIHDRALSLSEVAEENLVKGDIFGEASQNLVGTIMEGNETWLATDLQKRMSKKYPRVLMGGAISAEKEAWVAGSGAVKQLNTKIARSHGRAMVAGAAITAGALLLWGASRVRNSAPITEKDVPENLYGRSAPIPSSRQQMHTPSTRIVQNNTGYATNIDIDAGDERGIVDHSGMARTMSSMLNGSIGGGRINTSLHITDDSSGIDRESTRRRLNQQLSL